MDNKLEQCQKVETIRDYVRNNGIEKKLSPRDSEYECDIVGIWCRALYYNGNFQLLRVDYNTCGLADDHVLDARLIDWNKVDKVYKAVLELTGETDS